MKAIQQRHNRSHANKPKISRNNLAFNMQNSFVSNSLPPAQLLLDQANALMANNDVIAAERAIDQYLQHKPKCTIGLNVKAILAARQYKLNDAEKIWSDLVTMNPKDVSALANLGNMYRIAKRYDEAISVLKQALAITPQNADTHLNLGVTYEHMGDYSPALVAYDEYIRLAPTDAQGYFNKAHLMQNIFDYTSAFTLYRQALHYNPLHYGANANLIMTQYYAIPFDAANARDDAIRFGNTIRQQVQPYTQWQITPIKQRTLNIGFVSGDFRGHPVGFFLEPVLRALRESITQQHGHFKLHAYSNFINEDDFTVRLKEHFDHWSVIEMLSDDSLAKKIHDDAIDILIDLAGHSARNRLAAFVRKPAPVQVTWLGYFATTGLPEIDYLIADNVCAPTSEDYLYVESIWRLSQSRLVLFKPTPEITPTPLPCLNKPFTFGCFQEIAKINDDVLNSWSTILAACPQARLRIQSGKLSNQDTLILFKNRLIQHNIKLEQIELFGGMPRIEYLQAYQHIDVLLDTFPYPGGTTTVEALWMGVPTLTCITPGILGRQGAGILSSVGLEKWICIDVKTYIAEAIYYAQGDTCVKQYLADLRASLSDRCTHSPSADPVSFAHTFKNALQDMWATWCDKQAGTSTNTLAL